VLTFVSFLGAAQSPPDHPKMENRCVNANADQAGDVGHISRRVDASQRQQNQY
jgi:hypothetical protein